MSDYNTEQLKRQEREFQRSQQELRNKQKQEQRKVEKQRYESAVRGKRGCFPAGTLITTAQGDLDIAAVREGDFVTALDSHRRVAKSRRVLRVLKHNHCRIWCIRFADGQVMRTTAIHCFLVGTSWVQARYLREGHLVSTVSSSGEVAFRRVLQSISTDEVEDVYNLVVEDNFTFLAEGAVAHSFTHFRSFRTSYWKIRLALASCWRALSERFSATRVMLQHSDSLRGYIAIVFSK